jgi:hypothetical protein
MKERKGFQRLTWRRQFTGKPGSELEFTFSERDEITIESIPVEEAETAGVTGSLLPHRFLLKPNRSHCVRCHPNWRIGHRGVPEDSILTPKRHQLTAQTGAVEKTHLILPLGKAGAKKK